MSMVGTFDGFTAARLGLYAAQHGLRVTGNNVANINTVGYTRQRVDQTSFKTGANDMYRSFYDNHVGSGALVTGINQIRDPYLDIRYRNASTDTYHYDTWLSGLQNIASILDEVGKGKDKDGLIYRQIQDLAEKLRTYSANPTELNDRLVRNSATSLTDLFHYAATQLEKLYDETVTEFHEDISAVNGILTNIRDLNKSIREAEIHGDHALEMRDERNRQLDALSQYLDIKVEYSYENIGGGIEVEKLTIKLNNANPDSTVHTDESILVDGVFATQLSVPEEKPVLNATYDSNSLYWYLKGYTYTKAVPDGPELDQFLTENPDLIFDDLLPGGVDEKGRTLYLIGTNDSDVDGIVTEKNDNFTIQLGKLLNAKGEEWKTSTTAWVEMLGAGVPSYAKYTYNVNIDTDADDFKFTIKNGDDEIQCEVPKNKRGSAAEILAYVAQELNQSGKYPDYNITASADGKQLIFTAKEPGKLGDDATEPGFNVEAPPNSWIVLDTTNGDNPVFTDGYLPGDAGTVETDEHGNVIKSVDYVEIEGKWYQLTIATQYTHEIILDDNDLHGILQAEREMLTEEGEFSSAKDVAIDESALTKRGIKYYQQSLDLLAQKFAKAYNQLNSGYAFNQDGNYIKENGEELLINEYEYDEDGEIVTDETTGEPVFSPKPVSTDGLTKGQLEYLMNNKDDVDLPDFSLSDYVLKNKDGYLIDENGSLITDEKGNPISADAGDDVLLAKAVINMEEKGGILEKLGGWKMGGDLFTNLDGESTEKITAKTISISHGWSNGLWNLIPTFKMLFTESGGLAHSTKNDNADHMVAMINNALTYNPRDLDGSDAIGPELFNGSFNDMLSNMMAKEGEDASITSVRLTTSSGILNEVEYSREGVSGVDLNDEAMNMVSYQKAMTAAMRVMTVIDEMLDRLINNTGIAGR